MVNPSIIRLTALSLLGFLHWFFGNLYEAIVFSPNYLISEDKVALLECNRQLFQFSAPYFYFLPWSAVSILLVVGLFVQAQKHASNRLKKWASLSLATALSSGLLTYFIVTVFNLEVWVGTKVFTNDSFLPVFRRNFWMGNARLISVALTAYFLYQCLRVEIDQFIKRDTQ